jgi:hypothetical protein
MKPALSENFIWEEKVEAKTFSKPFGSGGAAFQIFCRFPLQASRAQAFWKRVARSAVRCAVRDSSKLTFSIHGFVGLPACPSTGPPGVPHRACDDTRL